MAAKEPKKAWQEIAASSQKRRDETIAAIDPPIPDVPSELPRNVTHIPRELLTTKEVEITESSPEEILEELRTGRWSAFNVTNAFLRRAGLAQKLCNCITELLPQRALERAKYLDRYFAEHKTPIGPLHGLPISVKEHLTMKGLDINAGFVGWVGRVGEEDSHILRLLWNAGAVFYVRTTQPQTLMHLETSSNLYGVTVNPFNRELTSGGSSGGEGALLGLRGSCLGIGTDIGGSIRSPAANNGVFGLKPTSYRLPVYGWSAAMLGEEQIIPCIGPMSTSLEGIKLFMKVLIDQRPWLTEPSLLPFEWRDSKDWLRREDGKRRLKVAVLWDDGIVKPHPPIIAALQAMVHGMKKSEDISVVNWKPYKHDLAWEIIASLYFCDGGDEEMAALESSGEPLRPLSEFILKENPHTRRRSIDEVWKLTVRREQYKAAYAKIWNDTGKDGDVVDVILCPVGPGAAPPLDCSRYWGYTSQWNLLDYPALVFPITKSNPDRDAKDLDYVPRNEQDRYNYDLYDPEKYRDAPISLQLVGRRYEDEKVIQALDFIMEETGWVFDSKMIDRPGI
ncbi:putative fatty-acid amide hydrolase [Patellaria atrata CBS 101060]|uniref:amidase n=1 Tax=Patellaria atrata CBS 101060 TaxID=1346257 RepID=A0A9P4VL29_9PEZI|nr:putative fatty-acid amide hydrolase [Patellaria atrata CBS 101060]